MFVLTSVMNVLLFTSLIFFINVSIYSRLDQQITTIWVIVRTVHSAHTYEYKIVQILNEFTHTTYVYYMFIECTICWLMLTCIQRMVFACTSINVRVSIFSFYVGCWKFWQLFEVCLFHYCLLNLAKTRSSCYRNGIKINVHPL